MEQVTGQLVREYRVVGTRLGKNTTRATWSVVVGSAWRTSVELGPPWTDAICQVGFVSLCALGPNAEAGLRMTTAPARTVRVWVLPRGLGAE